MSGIVDLIFQDQVWVDGNKKVHQIATMDIMHCRNLIRFLAEGDRPKMTIAGILGNCMCGPALNGEVAQDGFDSMIDHLMYVQEDRDRARKWLLEQPLLMALMERAGATYQKPEREKPTHRKVAFVVSVKVAADFDTGMLEYEIEDALKHLGYEIEIQSPMGG
jgi:hypothetical protein